MKQTGRTEGVLNLETYRRDPATRAARISLSQSPVGREKGGQARKSRVFVRLFIDQAAIIEQQGTLLGIIHHAVAEPHVERANARLIAVNELALAVARWPQSAVNLDLVGQLGCRGQLFLGSSCCLEASGVAFSGDGFCKAGLRLGTKVANVPLVFSGSYRIVIAVFLLLDQPSRAL